MDASSRAIELAAVRMSTVEIADRTDKQHGHVLRDARKMLGELYGADASKFGGMYQDQYGREKPCLLLPKREVMILITGYRVDLRAAVIDRLLELEAAERERVLPTTSLALEPPAELFPPNVLERFAGTAVAQIKRFGASVWQAKTAIFERIDVSDQKAIERDRYLAKQTIAVREEVREVLRYLTREPDWVTMSEMLRGKSITDARGLVSRLSKEAEAWFTVRALRLQTASPHSNLRATWFERTQLQTWWREEGERLYKHFIAKRLMGPVLVAHKGKTLVTRDQ